MAAVSIYLDANATTPVLPEVVEAMQPFWAEHFGNPASAHRFGQKARQALEQAREEVASLLDAEPDEVVFTSGATEANHLALVGQCPKYPTRLLAAAIEHPSVWDTVQALLKQGHALQTMRVCPTGEVQVPEERDLQGVGLATLMLANHETGAIQPARALAQALGNTPVHIDATQAIGKIPISFRQLGVTTLCGSAHKFHGPKGVGLLLIRRGCALQPQHYGGHQQQGRRPGTEAVPLVIGLATALRLTCQQRETWQAYLLRLRMLMLEQLQRNAGPFYINGPDTHAGMVHTLNLSFPGCKAESLLMRLDLDGVACSAGSACSSGSLLPSPVLQAMGLAPERLHSAIRISLHARLPEEHVRLAGDRISRAVQFLRQQATPTPTASSLQDAAP